MVVLGVIIAGVLLIGLWASGIYNRLVTLQQSTDAAWAQVQNVYQRRADLIPNLVNTVKGYAAHEKGTLDAVINARAKATSATLPADRIKAEGELSGALGRLLAVSEAYPNLKANENFLGLQNELRGTEDRIAFSRQAYNDSVTQYNTSIQTFPAVLFAGFFGFKEEPFFETPAAEKEAPKVDFGA